MESPRRSGRRLLLLVVVLAGSLRATPLAAQATTPQPTTPPAADVTALAKEQQNPISSLVSMPLQNNFNTGGGLEDRTQFLLNAQPVLPFKLSDRWNVVSRTVLPIVSAPGPDDSRYSGIGDIQQQLYLTPSKGRTITGVSAPCSPCPRPRRRDSKPAAGRRGRRSWRWRCPVPG